MEKNVRKTKVAGQFYDKDPIALQLFIDSAKVDNSNIEPIKTKVKAVILPHAGYVFSGKTAIKTLITAKENSYKNIIIIAPSHYVGFSGIAFSTYEEYETPLGNVTVNKELVNKLTKDNFAVKDEPHKHEHSLEVQLPLIKDLFPNVSITPIICGSINNTQAKAIAEKLQNYWKDDDILWIISSDFTHYGKNFNYTPFTSNIEENLNKLDNNAIKKILELNPESFNEYLIKTGITICGKFPILIMLYLAKYHSDSIDLKTKLIEYTTSGHLTGDFHHCVSYAGITVYKNNEDRKIMATDTYSKSQQTEMLLLARKTIESKLKGEAFELNSVPDHLTKTRSCFVTLHTNSGHLRGCIGNIIAFEPLYDNIKHNALNSSFADPRFPKVSSSAELNNIHIEISVLTPPEKIKSYDNIILGKHGIIFKCLGRNSVFLPQVAPEQGWDISTTLTHLSLKAGVSGDAWQKSNASFETFEAIVFKE
jgi:MEMO1 family protein